MRPPEELELVALWERGCRQHPLDRGLLLSAFAREDLDPSVLADLPMGAVHEAVLRLRRAAFGDSIDAHADCPSCGERLEVRFDVSQLLAMSALPGAAGGWSGSGFRVRLPTTRDLAAIAHERDADRAALAILERCCTERPESADLTAILPEADAGLEALDPLANVEVAVSCQACSRISRLCLDVTSLVWEEIAAAALAVLGQVHVLARAYGWSEPEILALSPERRAAYLEWARA